MAFLTLDGSTLEVTEFEERGTEFIGMRERAASGAMRQVVRTSPKRRWTATLAPMSQSSFNTLVSDLDPYSTATHTLSGDAVGTSHTVTAEISGTDWEPQRDNTWKIMPTIEFVEV